MWSHTSSFLLYQIKPIFRSKFHFKLIYFWINYLIEIEILLLDHVLLKIRSIEIINPIVLHTGIAQWQTNISSNIPYRV